MKTLVRASFSFLIVYTVLLGLVYPLVTTAVAQAFFPEKANGSLLDRNGKPVGSELIGQPFTRPEYFWGRLSATGGSPYNPMASGGSNYGAMHPGLVEAAKARIAALRAADSTASGPVPMDLVTASGSGLDPDISVAAAEYQAARVARARGLTVEQVEALVYEYTEGPFLGFSGTPRVNVLRLNSALDALDRF